MKELEISVQDIKELMEAFSRSGMGSLELQQGEFSLKLEGKRGEQGVVAAGAPVAAPVPAAPAAEPEAPAYRGRVVTSHIVGNFYAAPAPEKPPYVSVGSKVKMGDVLFIIESMKLMNEVTSEHDGTVTEILVENAQGVEYGQPILSIE